MDAYRAENELRLECVNKKYKEAEYQVRQLQQEKQVLEVENKVAIASLLEKYPEKHNDLRQNEFATTN